MKCALTAPNDLACLPNGKLYKGYRVEVCHGNIPSVSPESVVEEPIIVAEPVVQVEETPVEETPVVEEPVAPVTEEPVVETTPAEEIPVVVNPINSELLKTCGSTSPRQCTNSGACNQQRCPLTAPNDLACLPQGKQYTKFRLDICAGNLPWATTETPTTEEPKVIAVPNEFKFGITTVLAMLTLTFTVLFGAFYVYARFSGKSIIQTA